VHSRRPYNVKPQLFTQPDYTVPADANGDDAIVAGRERFRTDDEAVNGQMLLNFERSNFIN